MNPNQKSRTSAIRPAEAGFTLVEIMVVVVILGLLATLVAHNVIRVSDDARVTTAQANVKTIADGVRSYRARNGKLPENLRTLTTKDERGHSELEEVSLDPWGNAYEMQNGDGADEWVVVSCGPDGCHGTSDDISSKMTER